MHPNRCLFFLLFIWLYTARLFMDQNLHHHLRMGGLSGCWTLCPTPTTCTEPTAVTCLSILAALHLQNITRAWLRSCPSILRVLSHPKPCRRWWLWEGQTVLSLKIRLPYCGFWMFFRSCSTLHGSVWPLTSKCRELQYLQFKLGSGDAVQKCCRKLWEF